MTDAQNPQDTTPSPQGTPPVPPAPEAPAYTAAPEPPSYEAASPSYEAAPPAYPTAPPAHDAMQPPAYPGAYPNGGAAPAGPVPGKTLGIVALIVSFFAAVIGLILGLVARSQSKKAGVKNIPARAAIIVSSVIIVLAIISAIIFIPIAFSYFNEVARFCSEVGPGIHETTSGFTIPCD